MENKFLFLLVSITAQFLLSEGRTCYFYDYSKTCSDPNCHLRTIQCKHDHEKCFSFYGKDNDGALKVLIKGCWKQDNSCSQTGCIFRKVGQMEFCCCTGDLCNSSSPSGVKVTTADNTSK